MRIGLVTLALLFAIAEMSAVAAAKSPSAKFPTATRAQASPAPKSPAAKSPSPKSSASLNAAWAVCAKAAGDDAIAACDSVIGSGGKKGAELAIAYADRCTALYGKRDYDRALPDCDEAIRLEAQIARAHASRCGILHRKREFSAPFHHAMKPFASNRKSQAITIRGATSTTIATSPTAQLRTAPRRFASAHATPPPTATVAMPGTGRRTTTARLPIATKPFASIRGRRSRCRCAELSGA